jgi:hypothetical protein
MGSNRGDLGRLFPGGLMPRWLFDNSDTVMREWRLAGLSCWPSGSRLASEPPGSPVCATERTGAKDDWWGTGTAPGKRAVDLDRAENECSRPT